MPLLRVEGFEDGLPIVHGFTTRAGGDAPPPFDGLPLATAEGLDDSHVAASWAAVLASLQVGQLALVRQVHGADVIVADAPSGALGVVATADAIVTTRPGLAVAVRVADCVPILLAAPGGVAAVHAGWRGVVAGVLPRAIRVLCEATGATAGQVRAAVGPHIGIDAFEVGPEVVSALEAAGLSGAEIARPGLRDRHHVDLGAAVRRQLREAGVEHVGATGGCTTSGSFWSWRAQGPRTGRQAGVVAWRG